MVAIGKGNTLLVIDSESGVTTTLDAKLRDSSIVAVAASPNARHVATISDGMVRVQDTATGAVLTEIKSDGLKKARFSPDGGTLILASDYTLEVWDWKTNRRIGTPCEAGSYKMGAAFIPGRRAVLVWGCSDEVPVVWDLHTAKQASKFGAYDDVEYADVSNDGRYIVTTHSGNTARVWRSTTGQMIKVLRQASGSMFQARFSPNTKLVVAASAFADFATVWSVETGAVVSVLEHDARVELAQFDEMGRHVVTSTSDGSVHVFETDAWTRKFTISRTSNEGDDAIFSPDSNLVAVAAEAGKVRIVDARTGVQLRVLDHKSNVTDMHFSADSSKLVTLEAGGWSIWNVQSGIRLEQNDSIHRAQTVEGDLLALSDYESTKIWRLGQNELIASLPVTGDNVALSRDGEWLVASQGKELHLWSVKLKQELAKIPFTNRAQAAFLPRKEIVISSAAGDKHLWRVPETSKALVDLGCQLLPRPLTREERAKAFLDPNPSDAPCGWSEGQRRPR